MTHEEKLQLVDDLYAATGAGDWEKAKQYLTEDLHLEEAPGLPMGGSYDGHDALYDLFVKVMSIADVSALTRHETTTGGDFAICYLSMEFADPELEAAELCELFRFRDGKVCEIKPFYFDPDKFIAAAEAKKAKG